MNAKTNIVAGNSVRGIVPQDFDQVCRIANAAVNAGAKPLSTPHNKPDPTHEEQLAAASIIIMAGLEIGLPPTQALEVIAMINGRRCIWGDGIPALLWSNGFKLRERIEGDGDERVAYCSVIRPDGEEIERKFSVKQAKKANLWDTRETVRRKYGNEWKGVPNDSPWFKYDERMLQMRARGWASRDGASDVLRGLRVAEEERDYQQIKDITPQANDSPQLPDITDLPDIPEDEGHEGLLAMLRHKAAEGDRDEVWAAHEELIGELPEVVREKAVAIFETSAE
jgi:hypothetical protein